MGYEIFITFEQKGEQETVPFITHCLPKKRWEFSGTANLKRCHLEKACGGEAEGRERKREKGREGADGVKGKKTRG